jgi:ABC-type lipoprotein export system ATPase subunit
MSEIAVQQAEAQVLTAQRAVDVVVAEGLTKLFTSGPEEVRAVDDISFRFPRGKMIAVRGSSGSGKSTLLNLLGALDRPTGGELLVDDVNVGALAGRSEVDYRRRKVGFVFQSFNLIPQFSALENVMLPMDFLGLDGKEQADRARRLLKQVGIDIKRHDHRPAKLSGGQQQRVAIARALANDPPLILADEPTANLDNKTGRIIVELLHGLCREGRTVIVATHDSAIAGTADHVVEMEDGKIIRERPLGK